MCKTSSFLSGVAAGVFVTTAMTWIGSNTGGYKRGKRALKKGAGKIFHAVGNFVDNFTDNMMD